MNAQTSPFLCVVPQRHAMDCAVACLAMLFGLSYEDVLMAFKHNVIAKGATVRQLHDVAKTLGHPLHRRRAMDLENDTGLLSISSPHWKNDHLVVLKDGMLFDTDATVWELETFMSAYQARPLSILVME